jgi:T4 RnlA family RNA ligase
MYNTELGRFCAEHENWEELLTAAPYNLKISEDGPYVMFKYNQLSSDFNNPIVQEARGIIFRKGQWENPVCWAFNKFFNSAEPNAAELDWSTAFVTEKVDGSLIKVWWDGEWNISTNGTIDAFRADIGNIRMTNFGEYFDLALSKYYDCASELMCQLDSDLTYMFELVGPYNRVVIPYNEPEIYFLGARNKFTGEQYTCDAITMEQLGVAKFRRPKVYSLKSIDDCVKLAETFSWDQEGFVACDAQFNRVKIKSPAYVMAHFARNNNVITRKHLISIILKNEVEEFLCYAADYKEELEKIQNLMNAYCKVGDQIATQCQKLYDIPRKTYAAWVQTLPRIYQDLAFRNHDYIVSTKDYTYDWGENKWDAYLEAFEELKNTYFGGSN